MFAEPLFPPLDHVTHDITLLDPDAKLPKPKQYRLSLEELAKVYKQLDTYLEHSWICLSVSPYGAPILFAYKKDKSLHMCTDFHALNQQTCKDIYPIPHIEYLLDKLAHSDWFLKMDLA